MRAFISSLITIMGWLLLSHSANGATATGLTENWVMCNSCQSEEDFITAGTVWYGSKLGNRLVVVGNPDSGVVYSMWMERNTGGTPRSVSSDELRMIRNNMIISVPEKNVISPADLKAATQNGGVTVDSYGRDTNTEPVFRSMVLAHKNQILFNVSSIDINNPSFSSFINGSSEMQELCPRIWQQEASINPGFANFAPTASQGLSNALKAYFGRGILASVVFTNGDVATFEVNPLDTNSCPYVKGSAKNMAGQSLPDATPNVGGGTGGGVKVSSSPGADPAQGSYSIDSQTWLFCAFVGGVLQGCYIERIVP